MADITTPLKQFTDAVLAQEAAARKKEMVGVVSKTAKRCLQRRS